MKKHLLARTLSADDIPEEYLSGRRRVAVAVSGGPDSMALCWLLSQKLKKRKGVEIHALTVDHGLRAESAAEARQVRQWLKAWPFVKHKVIRRSMEGKSTTSRIMEDARHDRYALLAGYCRHHGIDVLFTAHHQDDQAETFLFRLAKGSGLDGLCAMRPVQAYDDGLSIVRPLLEYPKENLVATCRLEKIPFIEDPSNRNENFARVRLRHSGAVLAREGLTAGRLSRTAQRMARAKEALDFYAEQARAESLKEETESKTVLSLDVLAGVPADIRLRVIQKTMEKMGYKKIYPPSLEKLEEIAGRMFADPAFRRATLGGFMLCRDSRRDGIVIEFEKPPRKAR